MDFTKFSKEELGKAYEEIVGYNPFADNKNLTVDEVSKWMNEYDKDTKGTPYPSFSDWFSDGPVHDPPNLRYRDDGGTD